MEGIEFQRVVKRFDSGVEALHDVSLSIASGSLTFLTGHSGAGKSTFLQLLLGQHTPTRGRILVNGVDIGRLRRRQLPLYRRHLGAVFQNDHLLPRRTVSANVAVSLQVAGMRARETERRVRAALDTVELLDKAHLLPGHLSAGERQRVVIARAVANRPKLLLADEPTGNLDPALSESVMGLFGRFVDVGTTVIVATHEIDLVRTLGRRTVALARGRIVDDSREA
ncbi:MAG: ATP-binding cassette domain-containing protein [Pseudomonadales bacterium]|nr:ATP-binding cassette domain-containing protein [Pseudomonadales bacterium]